VTFVIQKNEYNYSCKKRADNLIRICVKTVCADRLVLELSSKATPEED
jgi:hypothetical protein